MTYKRQEHMDKYNSNMVAALETAWAEIQKHFPEVPSVVLVVASGSKGRGGLKWGHWAPGRWKDGVAEKKHAAKKKRIAKKRGAPRKAAEAKLAAQAPAGVSEVLISGEGLRRGGADTMTTLLHEAAHGLAFARGIKDTSRGGRYHNKRFARLGEELGLTVNDVGAIGYSDTTMPPATAKKYARTIKALDKAIAQSFRGQEGHSPTAKKPSRMLLAECQCEEPRKLRIAQASFDVAAITCRACDYDFALVDAD